MPLDTRFQLFLSRAQKAAFDAAAKARGLDSTAAFLRMAGIQALTAEERKALQKEEREDD